MTFTYTPLNPTDLTRVRYHIGDNDADTEIFSDEEINFVLAEEGSVGKAVISCIHTIMARLANTPDTQADWLKVDWRRSAESWQDLLSRKQQQFGIGGIQVSSRSRHAYRPDSDLKTSPDYDES